MARSLPSEGHHGLCVATDRQAGEPHHKQAAQIWRPATRLLASAQAPGRPRLLPRSRLAHSHGSPLQRAEGGYINEYTCKSRTFSVVCCT